MQRRLSIGLLLALLMVVPLPATAAAPFDHLRCDKIRDTGPHGSYTVDLPSGDPAFPSQAGCTVRLPAKLLCVDVQKTNVVPPPPGAPDGPQAAEYLCYKMKCPQARVSLPVGDQFGQHQVAVSASDVLCAPVTTTTTATTTTSTTTTTLLDADLVIVDPRTGLMWELKRNLDGVPNYADPHDADNRYSWCADGAPQDNVCDDPSNPPTGTAFADILSALNTPPCFGGFCDWHLPAHELLGTLADTTRPGCDAGGVPCSIAFMDPTATPFSYIASDTFTYQGSNAYAYIQAFYAGAPTGYGSKWGTFFVRAVRTGS